MKKVIVFLMLGILLISLVSASKMTASAVDNDEEEDNVGSGSSNNKNDGSVSDNSDKEQERERVRDLTQAQVAEIRRERNRLRIQAQTGECPTNCTCDGSATRCELRDGRELTIQAGESGNIIVQSKNTDAATSVTLYKSDGKVYGVFEGNATREVKMLPDQVKDKVRERLASELTDEEIELDEDGVYRLTARQRVRLFSLINLRERIRAEADPETGEIIRVRRAWWAFLTSREQPLIVGGSCGTVSPDNRDECCQTKGFDYYDSDSAECLFNAE